MPTRRRGHTLDRWEIALVKAMLGRGGYNDQDILAYFTRPTRSINHRVISEIRTGARYGTARAASAEELDEFLATWPEVDPQTGLSLRGLIRRAAFHAAGLKDNTPYHTPNLALAADNDDVQAARLAVAQLATRNVARWAAEAGPLPRDPVRHGALIDTVRRGTEELRTYLNSVAWP